MSHYRRFFEQLQAAPRVTTGPAEEAFPWASLVIPAGVRTILDVGCGRGEFIAQLPSGYWAVGVDLICPGKPAVMDRFVQASAAALPFSDLAFDLVTCFEVLEQLPEGPFREAIAELQRVSKTHLVISVPNREVLAESLVICPGCDCAFHPSWHVRSFDPLMLRGLFSDFEMQECRAVGPPVRYGGTRVSRLAVLGARRAPPPIAVCPQCGRTGWSDSSTIDELSVNSGTAAPLRRAFFLLLFRHVRPYWLLATYARRTSLSHKDAGDGDTRVS
ncbi:MAG TPA: class I SAM-dependent methyltransferase [bacterium]|nr:class I SAM-dependent methyltransferase [bacterium]